jgi:hypothetical protein
VFGDGIAGKENFYNRSENMKTIFTMFGVLVALGALGAGLYGCYLVAGYLWGFYADLDAVFRLVLLSSIVALLLASMIVAGSIRKAAQLNSSSRLMEAKLNLYKSVVEAYQKNPGVLPAPTRQMQAESIARLQQLEAELTILASGPVIEAQRKLQTAFEGNETDSLATLFQQLVKSIRRDLGHGSGYDESKLRFLGQDNREAHPDPRAQGSSS